KMAVSRSEAARVAVTDYETTATYPAAYAAGQAAAMNARSREGGNPGAARAQVPTLDPRLRGDERSRGRAAETGPTAGWSVQHRAGRAAPPAPVAARVECRLLTG